jgi:hypothetical protein
LELIQNNSEAGTEDSDIEGMHRKEFKIWIAKKVK